MWYVSSKICLNRFFFNKSLSGKKHAKMFSFYLIALWIQSVVSYSTCDPKNYPYAGQNVSIHWATQFGVYKYGTPVTASGTVNIIDGCNVRNIYLFVV